nr:hypothetical protein Iba_chr09eCG5110 [Ipomoea batatas]
MTNHSFTAQKSKFLQIEPDRNSEIGNPKLESQQRLRRCSTACLLPCSVADAPLSVGFLAAHWPMLRSPSASSQLAGRLSCSGHCPSVASTPPSAVGSPPLAPAPSPSKKQTDEEDLGQSEGVKSENWRREEELRERR